MLKAQPAFLEQELNEVVRLFAGAEEIEIELLQDYDGAVFRGVLRLNGEETRYAHEGAAENELVYKSLARRYSKLALYNALSAHFSRHLPWGALTGIRPTRLARGELEKGRDFLPLFHEMDVGEDNIELVSRVIGAQEGIFERKEGNCDLYVSLPFCPTRCVYCSFVTAPIDKTRQYIPVYLDAVKRELEGAEGLWQNLRSVYIGGGTPFALETEELRAVLEAVKPLRTNGCEYTVEAGRPDVFTEEKLALCKEYGVTRICINAQSFSDRTLEAIGRKHTAKEVGEAFELARPFGFVTNCDLIAGLTGESLEEFCGSIDAAVALSPDNITVHTLCLKKGARLKEEVESLKEGDMGEMIAYAREKLTAAGYEPYYLYRQKYMAGAHENTGWTKPGRASVYNIDVMEETADNFAVGANAVTKKVFLKEGRIERIGSPKDLPTYLEKTEKLIEEKRKLFSRT